MVLPLSDWPAPTSVATLTPLVRFKNYFTLEDEVVDDMLRLADDFIRNTHGDLHYIGEFDLPAQTREYCDRLLALLNASWTSPPMLLTNSNNVRYGINFKEVGVAIYQSKRWSNDYYIVHISSMDTNKTFQTLYLFRKVVP